MVAESGAFPTWNPDGSEILYTTRNEDRGDFHAYTVPALGGVSNPVPGLDNVALCTYSNAGDRIACVDANTQALVIAGPNGENRRVVPGTAGSDGVMMPAWSPDDKLVAFSRGNQAFFLGDLVGNIAPSSVWVVRADGGTPVRISDNTHLNVSPAWTLDGAVLFISTLGGNRDIYLQQIDGDLSPRGSPVRLTTGLNAHTISVDREGKTLAYSVFNTVANVFAAPISGDIENPRMRQVTTGNQTVESASISADGKWLAYDSNINGNQDIFKMPVGGGEPLQLTHNNIDNFAPSWSPDGRQIAFHSLVKGNRDVYIMDASGGKPTAIAATPSEELVPIWRPDGKGLAYLQFPDSAIEIMRDPGSPTGWSAPKFRGTMLLGKFSPDGKMILIGSPDGPICPHCAPGGYIFSSDWTNPRLIPLSQMTNVVASPGSVVWSRDSRHAFALVREGDGTSAIWQLPINGDLERRVLHLTDPNRQIYRTNTLDADATNFYFTIGDRQSDIWTMELKKQ
ncbi:MAG: hypothetical protein ABJC63_06770 [Gemmatimonadales bacterium]